MVLQLNRTIYANWYKTFYPKLKTTRNLDDISYKTHVISTYKNQKSPEVFLYWTNHIHWSISNSSSTLIYSKTKRQIKQKKNSSTHSFFNTYISNWDYLFRLEYYSRPIIFIFTRIFPKLCEQWAIIISNVDTTVAITGNTGIHFRSNTLVERFQKQTSWRTTQPLPFYDLNVISVYINPIHWSAVYGAN